MALSKHVILTVDGYAVKLSSPLKFYQNDQLKCLKMFANTLSDEQALQVPLMYDEFEANRHYIVGERVLYQDVLYKVITEHTSQATWTPDVAPSLFAKVINESTDGNIPEWVQPDSTNAYSKGDKVSYNGHIYESVIDGNVWSPDAYPQGWQLIE